MTLTFVPIIIIFAVALIMILIARSNIKKARLATKRYGVVKSYQTAGRRYIPGQFSAQLELDMRLPYKRFKQLYPENRWTYQEYKRMQMQTAFRRSYSSQDNKRMVR
jgi:hypothetical protein